MFEVIQSFWAPKTPGYEQEYEDAANWNRGGTVAAIADGVSSAIFSRAWADILTTAVVTDPPDNPTVDGNLTSWLTPHRQAWSDRIELPKLKWNQVAKLNQIGGGWVTLLWLQLEQRAAPEIVAEDNCEEALAADRVPDPPDDDSAPAEQFPEESGGTPTSCLMTCHAIGDCNLFVVRDGKVRLSHPMQSSAAYAQKPQAVCSMNRGQDGQLAIQTKTFDCEQGDLLVLCTDAVGQWLWSELEDRNGEIDWQQLARWSEDEWHAEVQRLRGESRMPIDDCTLILLRVITSVLPESSTEIASAVAEEETNPKPESVTVEPLADDDASLIPESLESLPTEVVAATAELPPVDAVSTTEVPTREDSNENTARKTEPVVKNESTDE